MHRKAYLGSRTPAEAPGRGTEDLLSRWWCTARSAMKVAGRTDVAIPRDLLAPPRPRCPLTISRLNTLGFVRKSPFWETLGCAPNRPEWSTIDYAAEQESPRSLARGSPVASRNMPIASACSLASSDRQRTAPLG